MTDNIIDSYLLRQFYLEKETKEFNKKMSQLKPGQLYCQIGSTPYKKYAKWFLSFNPKNSDYVGFNGGIIFLK